MTWSYYFKAFWNISSRYFLLAGFAFLLWYLLWQKKILFKKIQPRFPKQKDYVREIIFSISTMLIFAAVPLLLIQKPATRPYTKWYKDIHQHGLFYFYAAFVIMHVIYSTLCLPLQ
jgi:Delta7-sterol 5-desaturase